MTYLKKYIAWFPAISLLLLITAWNVPGLSFLVLFGLAPWLCWLAYAGGKAEWSLIRLLAALFGYSFLLSAANLAWMFTGDSLWRPLLAIGAYATIATVCWWGVSHLLQKPRSLLSFAMIVATLVVHDYLHLLAEFGFPVLSWGNYFRHTPALVQWYSVTGVLGGTLLVAIANVTTYALLLREDYRPRLWAASVGLMAIPLLLSAFFFSAYQAEGVAAEVVALHTNYDCFAGKMGVSADSMAAQQLRLLAGVNAETTDLIVWPETALNEGEWLEEVDVWPLSRRLKDWLAAENSAALLLAGGIFHRQYGPVPKGRELPVGVDSSPAAGGAYYNHNTVLAFTTDQPAKYRVKHNLVPFEESFPYADQLGLRALGLDLSSLLHRGRQRATTFDLNTKHFDVGALICYEAAFGRTARELSLRKIGLLAIMTNEGWFDGLFTAREFAGLASLRAIETRKPIVRSSNRGITAIYDQRGAILKSLSGQRNGWLQATVNLNAERTIYTAYGDYLGWLSLLSLPFLLLAITLKSNTHALSPA